MFIGLLAMLVAVIWYALFYFDNNGLLRITFFDIGQGDSVFIEAPNGNQVLIDGGPSDSVLASLGRTMPFWDHSIDLLILTHPHADHLDGLLEVLKRYDIGMVLESDANYSTPEYKEWHDLILKKHIPIIRALRGERVLLGLNEYIDILAPYEDFEGRSLKNVHDSMVVGMLHYASTTVLLQGDAEKKLESRLVQDAADGALHADILKVGHHGSKTSSGDIFLKAVSPIFAVISVGRHNRYGHPHQEVIDRLHSFGINIFRTDEGGDIRFVSDGNRFARVP